MGPKQRGPICPWGINPPAVGLLCASPISHGQSHDLSADPTPTATRTENPPPTSAPRPLTSVPSPSQECGRPRPPLITSGNLPGPTDHHAEDPVTSPRASVAAPLRGPASSRHVAATDGAQTTGPHFSSGDQSPCDRPSGHIAGLTPSALRPLPSDLRLLPKETIARPLITK